MAVAAMPGRSETQSPAVTRNAICEHVLLMIPAFFIGWRNLLTNCCLVSIDLPYIKKSPPCRWFLDFFGRSWQWKPTKAAKIPVRRHSRAASDFPGLPMNSLQHPGAQYSWGAGCTEAFWCKCSHVALTCHENDIPWCHWLESSAVVSKVSVDQPWFM